MSAKPKPGIKNSKAVGRGQATRSQIKNTRAARWKSSATPEPLPKPFVKFHPAPLDNSIERALQAWEDHALTAWEDPS